MDHPQPGPGGQPWRCPQPDGPVRATLRLPGSKSMTNRALVLAALGPGPTEIRGPLHARDSLLMAGALRALGADVDTSDPATWRVTPGEPAGDTSVDVGNAGTVMRFVPPVAALSRAAVRFHGDPRASQRPVGAIIAALREIGAVIEDDGRGAIPFTVRGTGTLAGGSVTVDASASSQLVSGLLLAAPRYEKGLEVRHRGPRAPSAPHIAMTVQMLRDAGATVETATTETATVETATTETANGGTGAAGLGTAVTANGGTGAAGPGPAGAGAGAVDGTGPDGAVLPDTWFVHPGGLTGHAIDVEPDLVNSAPFLAAALVTGGRVTIRDWPARTSQPASQIIAVFTALGAGVESGPDGLTVTGTGRIRGITADLADVSEISLVVGALAALADGPSVITGIGHQRLQETDRLAALATEINALGGDVTERPGGLEIRPRPLRATRPASTYDDHRMVMAAAVLGLVVPGLEVAGAGTVAKTFPEFPGAWAAMLERAP